MNRGELCYFCVIAKKETTCLAHFCAIAKKETTCLAHFCAIAKKETTCLVHSSVSLVDEANEVRRHNGYVPDDARCHSPRVKKLLISIILLFVSFSVQAQELNIKIEPKSVGQGKTLTISFESFSTFKDLGAEFLGEEIRFYKTEKNRYRAILGIPLTTKPGRYEILFRVKAEEGLKIEWKEVVQIEKTIFKKETLSIPPKKSGHLTSKYLGKEGKEIKNTYKKEELEQHWKEKFILPAEGRISSPFGAYRVYNEGEVSWRHKGVDIANKEGTEVLAPNSGIIVLSEDMRVHGGTIIISHGQGVFSIFSHLKERLVKKDEEVGKGRLIGTMGQTGLATGSHLHWGLCTSGTVVDPLEWTKKKIGD